MHANPYLRATNLTVSRAGKPVIADATLTITPSSRLAIVGENGCGKTTLVHTLAALIEPEAGDVQRAGSIGLAMQSMATDVASTVGALVEQGLAGARAALNALETAADGLATGGIAAEMAYVEALDVATRLDAWDADRRMDEALAALDACSDRARPLHTLSVGQRYRVRLASVLGGTDDILLLDEPTNHLDRSALDFLTASIRTRRGGVAFVTHDRTLLRDAAEEFYDLDATQDGRPRLYANGYAGWQAGRRRELAAWREAYADEQREERRLREAVDQAQSRLTSNWRPEKGHNKHGRQTRAPGVVQALRRRESDLDAHRVSVPPPPREVHWPRSTTRPQLPILRGRELAVTGRLAGPVDVDLDGGDRLLVTGPNGAGKSTLLQVLLGALVPTTGGVRHLSGATIAGLAQEDDAHGPPLSIGQRRRRGVAELLGRRPDLIVLDEPTNHLAAWFVDELTEQLQTTPAAVIVATHDRQLLRDLDWPTLHLGESLGWDL